MERTTNRRQFIAGLALAALPPVPALAQTPDGKPRRIGIMMAVAQNDPEGLSRIDAFRRSLGEVGWAEGSNVNFEIGWYSGNQQMAETVAKDLVARGVEVMLVNGTPGMDAMRKLGAAVPVVFTVVSNPVGTGYVPNLSRPGGNVTGFSTFEPEITGKWLQLVRQVAPQTKNISLLFDPKFVNFHSLWHGIEEIAPKLGVKAYAAHASSLAEIEAAVVRVASNEAAGLIVAPSPVNSVNRTRLISLVNERRIPTVYPFRFYLKDGALMTYGFSATDQFKRAGAYVDRILRGEKAGDLPVQAPSVFELGINMKTAKSIGIAMPQSLLIAADEIIE